MTFEVKGLSSSEWRMSMSESCPKCTVNGERDLGSNMKHKKKIKYDHIRRDEFEFMCLLTTLKCQTLGAYKGEEMKECTNSKLCDIK